MNLVDNVVKAAQKAARAGVILLIPYSLIGCGKDSSEDGAPSIPAQSVNVLESKIDGLVHDNDAIVPLATGQQHTSLVTVQPVADVAGTLRWTIYDGDGHKDWSFDSPSLNWNTGTVVPSPNCQEPPALAGGVNA